ncbi:MAG: universal stress protein [Candidatus Brockarchaeota archaeon]|nr:universal stress protein [Candidatus Brockarchaeota archaeon]
MFKTILVAYDGSENAKKAFDSAIELAQKFQSKLVVVGVVEVPVLNTYGAFARTCNVIEVVKEIRAKVSADIERCVGLAREKGLDADGKTLEGDPATEILRHSKEINADLIVTGCRGLSTWKQLLLGSVSHKVVSESKASTMVVK